MHKKRYYFSSILYLVCFFLLSEIPTQAAYLTTFPSILGSISTAKAGDTTDVIIQLNNNPGITAIALDIAYDTNALTLVNVQDTNLMPESSFVTSPSFNYYPYRLVWTNGTKNVMWDGVLVMLSFKVKETAAPGNYEIEISYRENDIYNVSLENVSFQVRNPIIQIKSSQTNLPTDFLRGDADGNGSINLNDARLTLKTALNITPKPENANIDLDSDGAITLIDVQLVLKAALKIIKLI